MRFPREVGLQGHSWTAEFLGEELWISSCLSYSPRSSFTFSMGSSGRQRGTESLLPGKPKSRARPMIPIPEVGTERDMSRLAFPRQRRETWSGVKRGASLHSIRLRGPRFICPSAAPGTKGAGARDACKRETIAVPGLTLSLRAHAIARAGLQCEQQPVPAAIAPQEEETS